MKDIGTLKRILPALNYNCCIVLEDLFFDEITEIHIPINDMNWEECKELKPYLKYHVRSICPDPNYKLRISLDVHPDDLP